MRQPGEPADIELARVLRPIAGRWVSPRQEGEPCRERAAGGSPGEGVPAAPHHRHDEHGDCDIERGDRVSDDTLRKVAVAVNQDENAFTAERIHLSQDEVEQALEVWAAPYEGMTMVSVRHFTKQRQVPDLSRCDGAFVHSSHLREDGQSLVEDLREWIDLAGFIRATQEHDAFITTEPFTRMREFNRARMLRSGAGMKPRIGVSLKSWTARGQPES